MKSFVNFIEQYFVHNRKQQHTSKKLGQQKAGNISGAKNKQQEECFVTS